MGWGGAGWDGNFRDTLSRWRTTERTLRIRMENNPLRLHH